MSIKYNVDATIDQKIEGIQNKLSALTSAEQEAGEEAKATTVKKNEVIRKELLEELTNLQTERNKLTNITTT